MVRATESRAGMEWGPSDGKQLTDEVMRAFSPSEGEQPPLPAPAEEVVTVWVPGLRWRSERRGQRPCSRQALAWCLGRQGRARQGL